MTTSISPAADPLSLIDGKKRAFLEARARRPTITAAARLARVDRTSHYFWLVPENDPGGKYREAFEDAREQYRDRIRIEIDRRALHGVKRKVYYKGVKCGEETEYSDRLLELLAKAELPEFRERHEIIGDPDKPVEVRVVAVRYPTRIENPAEWAQRFRPKELPPPDADPDDDGPITFKK
jgi:hypothetical protein